MEFKRTISRMAGALLILTAAIPAFPQATIYTAGDPAAATSTIRGKPVCGSSTSAMAAIDGTSYSTYNASEFAAVGYEIRGSVPNPMGRDTSAATAGRWGVTIANPTSSPLNVTAVQIDAGSNTLFNAINAVQPATGWTRTTTLVSWAGSIDVPALSTYGFVVQIQGNNRAVTSVPITLRATTAAGTLTSSGWLTSERNNNDCPYVSLPWVVGGGDVFTGNTGNGGTVDIGSSHTFTVKIVESEGNNNISIPTGSTLTITVPPGWTGVSAASGQTGFGTPTVTAPTSCLDGTIEVDTTSPILASSRTFQFSATAPTAQGGAGLYTFTAGIESSSTAPPIATYTEFVQEVPRPLSSGTRGGITATDIYVSVPNPMGSKAYTTWGVAVANPTDNPLPVTSLQIQMTNNDPFFRGVTAIQPTSGWTYVSSSLVQWAGSVTVPPHDAVNFIARIQAKQGKDIDRPVSVTVNGTYTKSASTSEHPGTTTATSLYYSASGQPVVYTYGVPSGQQKTFQAVTACTESNVSAGTSLRIVVPAGWTAVDAPINQTGFTTRTVVQPTPTTDGEIRTTFSTSLGTGNRTFTFSATSPPNLIESLYVFPTALSGSDARSMCDMVARVVDASGGIFLEHLSPPIPETNINQIDLHSVGFSAPDTVLTESIYNFATAAWEPVSVATLGATSTTMLGSATAGLDQYFDAPITSSGKHLMIGWGSAGADNHRFDEDYVAIVISEYRCVPTSVAPAVTFRGAGSVPFEALRFETEQGSVDLYTVKAAVRGSDPVTDVSLVRLYADLDCDGAIDPGDAEITSSQSPDVNGIVTFGFPGTPMLSFTDTTPACALIAFDISSTATAFDMVGAEIAGGFDMTSSVGTLFPFPAFGGYPIYSNDALIPGGPPDLLLDKSASPSLISYPVGTTITYSIAVSNLGESASTNVVVTDDLDPVFSPFTGVVTPLDGGSLCLPPTCPVARVTWPAIGTLAGNSSQVVTLRFDAVLPYTIADGTAIANTAAATSNEQPAGATSNTETITACAPVVALLKTLPATPLDYAVGEIIQWNLSVSNTADCDAANLAVADIIDDTMLDESTIALNPAGSYDPVTNRLEWSLGTVAAGGHVNLSFSAKILAAAEGTTLCNGAAATWDQATAPLATPPSCTTVAIQPTRCQPALVVDKTLPSSPADYAEGETITWTVTVRNNGNCDATGVTLRDTIDPAVLGDPLVFTPDTGSYDAGSHTYTWAPVDVAANGAQVLTFTVSGTLLDGTEGMTVCDVAVANLLGTDTVSNPTTGTCTTIPVLPGPRCTEVVVVDKTLPASPADYAEGEPIVWTITVRNTGICDATGVTLRDTIDPAVLGAPLVFTPDTGSLDPVTHIYTWPAFDVGANGSQTLVFTVGGTLLGGTQGMTVCDVAVANYQGIDTVSNPPAGTCTTVPIIPPRCNPADIVAVQGFKAARQGNAIAFTWTDPGAPEHHVNQVAQKGEIPNARRAPAGVGTEVCSSATPDCIVSGVDLTTLGPVFYQALGACGPSGTDEGTP